MTQQLKIVIGDVATMTSWKSKHDDVRGETARNLSPNPNSNPNPNSRRQR